jgi:PilZ domain
LVDIPIMSPSTLNAGKPARTGSERRRSPRNPHSMEARVSSPTSKTPTDGIDASCINLSRHGVAFEVDKPLPVDAYYLITIGLGAQRMIGEVRSVSCRKTKSGRFEVGAEFI